MTEFAEFLRDTVKMKLCDKTKSSTAKTNYECLLCGNVSEYTGKYLARRYKKYGSVGCPTCSAELKRAPLLASVRHKLSDYYILSDLTKVKNVAKGKVTLRGKRCGHEFTANLGDMIYKAVSCPVCWKAEVKTWTGIRPRKDGTYHKKESFSYERVIELFEERNKIKHPIAIKDITQYTGMNGKMVFICGKCNQEWTTRPANILHLNSGCPRCSVNKYSKKSIEWLNQISAERSIHIRHAENGGELMITTEGGKRYYVDGYCKETNTVYEFHGSKYHGDPELFDPADTPHPYNSEITAEELLRKTMQKEEDLRQAGYQVITIWESEYDNLNKYIHE